MKKVIVIGGGVGGMTAAHELAERGYDVHLYEARASWGGKARSQPVPGTGTGGRADLPGEHGFRFYPRFYKHVIDMMERTPVPGGTVAGRLKPTTESAIALIDQDTWFRFHRRKLDRPYDVLEALELFFQTLDFDAADLALFGLKVLQFLTTSDARRVGELDDVSWWDYLQGDRYSPKFQRQLRAVPRTMVAMDPKRGSARTIGTVSMQLILDYASSGVTNDRTMGGPTTEAWLEPWRARLVAAGVTLHAGQRCVGLDVAGGRIAGARFAGAAAAVTGDHYVLALPLDVAHGLITPALAALDPALARLRGASLDDLVSWMVGIQFFLYEDVPMVRGHIFYPDSPWALTSISQPQFWRDGGLFRTRWGDGSVGGLISVDVSDWDTPGMFVNKPAKACTREEVAREVWAQLKAALNGDAAEEQVLDDAVLHSWHLDADLDYGGGVPPVNASRLLVHPPGAWAVRPEAVTAVPNLVLASDYVRTHTDLASMEGACEAAKRAVNGVLERDGAMAGGRVPIHPLEEPAQFERWKRLDAGLFAAGKPHLFEVMRLDQAFVAADLLRRFATVTGLARVDDLLDRVRLTEVVDGLLRRIGMDR